MPTRGITLPDLTAATERKLKLSSTTGFTLIELVVVVTVLGILASISIAKYNGAKEKAYIATILSDLRNISYAQELFFSDNYTYAQATPLLEEYSPSPDVILTMVATAEGWTARGTHKANNKYQCAVFSGDVAMNFSPSVESGAIACVPTGGGGGGGGGGGRGGGPP